LINKEKSLNNDDLSNSETIEDQSISKQFLIEELRKDFDHDKYGDLISFEEFKQIIKNSEDTNSDSNEGSENHEDLFAEFQSQDKQPNSFDTGQNNINNINNINNNNHSNNHPNNHQVIDHNDEFNK
jgi:hypothetical protein